MRDKPNLLFIFTDQQRCDTMACYGNDLIRTPNLNALASESIVFENAYVTQPVCTPSRSSIMTGQYPHTNGCTANNIPLRRDTRTIAEMVSDDYRCAYYGKWHLGDEISAQHGFEDWLSIEDYYRKYYSNSQDLARFSNYHHFLLESGFKPDREILGHKVFERTTAANLPEQFTKASFLGREAARFIRENAGSPFMLFVNFLEPHPPFTGPLNDLHRRDNLATGPTFLRKPPKNASFLHRMMADYSMQSIDHGQDLSTEAGWREIRARYWGLVTLVDRAVGRILGALEESGQADNTVVVYTSEHGDMMGDHGILHKTMMYEEDNKVPLLIRVPWLRNEGRLVNGRISQVDLAPTLLDLMNEHIPVELQGESRVPVLRGESTLAENDVFIEWNGSNGRNKFDFATDIPVQTMKKVAGTPWRTVISADGWKLNLSSEDQCELYDVNTDPYEQVNRYDDPGQRDRVRDLTCRIQEWQERTGDDTPLPPDA